MIRKKKAMMVGAALLFLFTVGIVAVSTKSSTTVSSTTDTTDTTIRQYYSIENTTDKALKDLQCYSCNVSLDYSKFYN